jgi:UDPglucose 6-dehydrogenase
MREAPSLTIVKQLQDRGVEVFAYDPVAQEQASKLFEDVKYFDNIDKMVKGVDCIVIATEWDEFAKLDWEEIKKLVGSANIVDGRNCLDRDKMKAMGWNYLAVGR